VDLARRLNPVCDRFEDAWLAGGRPRLEDFLAEAAPDERAALLGELLGLEIDYRVERGERPRAEEYHVRFPGHTDLVAEVFAAPAAPAPAPPQTLDGPTAANAPPPPVVARRAASASWSGSYLLGEELGAGGMGCVLRAGDPELGRTLAVKVLRPEHRGNAELERRFREEARITGQLQHPGVPPVHLIGALPDGRPFFAMKRVKGRTLAEILQGRTGPGDDLPRFLAVFEQVCQTMAYAHAQGVIHRDLKPANVMVGAFGEVQVMDWGLAKVLPGEASRERQRPEEGQETSAVATVGQTPVGLSTQVGQLLGTPAYMAPEQARGEIDCVDERADVFGLGAILCAILTGQPPFRGASKGEVQARAQRGDLADALARLDGCGADADLVRLARACLAPERAGRPCDAGAAEEAVAAYRAGVQERLRAAEVEGERQRVRAAEERRRRRLAVALAAAVLALAATGAGGGLWLERTAAQRRTEKALQKERAREGFEGALAQAERLRRQMRWSDAGDALDQAEGHLIDDAPPGWGERLRQARADLRTAKALDGVRLHRAQFVKGKGRSDLAAASASYARTFREHDWDVLKGNLAEAARIRDSAMRDELVAALDDWTFVERDEATRKRLLQTARAADPDPLKDQVRDLVMGRDRESLKRLARELNVARLSPALTAVLMGALRPAWEDRVALVRRALEHHPSDFWLNFLLATDLHRQGKPDEAIGFFRVALVLRPDAGAVHYNLGNALRSRGDRKGAIRSYRKAIQCDRGLAPAHNNLGVALMAEGDLEGAIQAYREAIRRDPTYAAAYANLGSALADRGDLEKGAKACREAVRLAPEDASTYRNLGAVLERQGRFVEARDAMLHARSLLPANDPQRPLVSQHVQQCRHLIALDKQLSAIREGEGLPPAADRLDLALFCRTHKHLYATAARFFADALAEQPELAGDRQLQPRYKAALAAALAASGKGKDAPRPDKEQARLRAWALRWLRAERAAWAKVLDRGPPQDRLAARKALADWIAEPAFAGLRDPAALALLPADEREAWRKLWADASALLLRAEERTRPGKE
jgi:serine/threonine-protein kinase